MHKLSRNTRVIFSIVAFLSLVSLACGLSSPRVTFNLPPTPQVSFETAIPGQPVQVQSTASSTQVASIFGEDQVLEDLYSRLNPSVVNITVYVNQNGELTLLAQGSGFVVDDQGHIVTNAHVVQGTDAVDVIFSDGLIRNATIVGEDMYSDLAVIKVDLPQGIAPIPLGSMDNLKVGQTVVAIGNPFGLEGTLTRGIVSALGRNIPTQTVFSIPEAIQTDAAINPGNSGGPLLNLDGEVVGVNAQIETNGTSNSSVGVGFAIPVSILQRVIPSLISSGSYDWPYLGVSGYTVNPDTVKAMNLPVEQGAYVSLVTDGGPAQAAGIQGTSSTITQDGRQVEIGGDVITAINGQPIKTFDELLVYLTLQTSPGDNVTLSILRNGQSQDVTVQLGTRPPQAP